MHSQSKSAITSTSMDCFQLIYLQLLIVENISGAIGLQTKILKEKQNHFGYKIVGGKQDRIHQWITPSSRLIDVESIYILHLTACFFVYRNEPLPGKVDSAKIDSVLSRKLNIKQSHKD